MKSRMGGIRRAKMNTELLSTKSSQTEQLNIEKEQNIIEWTTFFRRNWHIYVDMVLKIALHPFQQIMIYLMGVSDIFFAICSKR